MIALRSVAAGFALLLPLAGCAADGGTGLESSTPAASASSRQSSPSPIREPQLDLPRLADAAAALPSGFELVGQSPVPLDLIERLVDSVSAVVSYGKPFVVEPRLCRPLLKPVDAVAGAHTIRFRGDRGKEEQIAVGAVEPVTVPQPIPTAGCDAMTFQVDDDDRPSKGTVERLSAPVIAGATTIALKAQVDGWPIVLYSYAAILDEGGYVDVQTRSSPDFAPEPALPSLLAASVAAVRDQ